MRYKIEFIAKINGVQRILNTESMKGSFEWLNYTLKNQFGINLSKKQTELMIDPFNEGIIVKPRKSLIVSWLGFSREGLPRSIGKEDGLKIQLSIVENAWGVDNNKEAEKKNPSFYTIKDGFNRVVALVPKGSEDPSPEEFTVSESMINLKKIISLGEF